MSGWAKRLGLAAAGGIAALIVATIAICFLAEALFLRLEMIPELGPPSAAAIVGAAGLVLAALFALSARHALRPAAPKPTVAPRPGGVANNAAADLGALVAQQAVKVAHEHPYGTVGAALAAGLAVGAVPELRKALTGLFKG